MNGFEQLYSEIISNGLCTNCGTCIGICPRKVLEFDYNQEEPILTGVCTDCGMCNKVCSGKEIPLKDISKKLFGYHEYDERLGHALKFIKGYASDSSIRRLGASGGIVTAILKYAIQEGIVEKVLVTGQDTNKPWRGKAFLASTAEEVIAAARSKYVVVPANEALDWGECKKHNYGVVGLPCHIHGIRKIQLEQKTSKICSNLKFTIGIICGTNRSTRGVEHFLLENCEINSLNEITQLNYRGGPDGQDVEVITKAGNRILIPTPVWSSKLQAFSRIRCTMCYDFSAELADVSVGDIFYYNTRNKVPQWSAAIVRSQTGLEILEGAEKAGYIQTFPVEKNVFLGNPAFETKKHAVAMSLLQRAKYGWPVPNYGSSYNVTPEKQKCYEASWKIF